MRRSILVGVIALAAGVMLTGGTANAGAYCSEGPATESSGTDVDMKGMCFTPTALRVEPGDEVTFTNHDAEPHAVAGSGGTFGEPHKEILRNE